MRKWRKPRKPELRGDSQINVRWPPYKLTGNEEVRGKQELYKVTFESQEHRQFVAKRTLREWQSLEPGVAYWLGRNTLGRVIRIEPMTVALSRASKKKGGGKLLADQGEEEVVDD